MIRYVRWSRSLLAALVLIGALAERPAAAVEEFTDQQVLAILASEQPRDRAIRKALAWLRDQQQPDGSIMDERKNSGAITALALMAHLAAGITVDDSDHGAWMQRSLRYVLGLQSANGYFGQEDRSRMYGHGIMTLMLAEALGMVGDPGIEERIRTALQRAVALTERAARVDKKGVDRGGWRYRPDDKDSDLSLSGWQLMSLHACQQVGIPVDEEVVTGACDYADRLTTDDGEVGYQKPGQDDPALRGVSLLSFAIAGREDDEQVDAVVDRIKREPAEWKGSWLFYRLYYDSVGMSRARPDQWKTYRDVLEPVLLDHQHQAGWWPDPPGGNEARFGKVYTTSMAVLALTVERHVLPAYQR